MRVLLLIEYLRDSSEFRLVYDHGKRYEGQFLTAFIQRNNLKHHRLGITASRKLSQRAVHRNRMKRLLRESFRLSAATLNNLPTNYDWVLNAKRSLLKIKVAASIEDFQKIIARVSYDESNASIETDRDNL